MEFQSQSGKTEGHGSSEIKQRPGGANWSVIIQNIIFGWVLNENWVSLVLSECCSEFYTIFLYLFSASSFQETHPRSRVKRHLTLNPNILETVDTTYEIGFDSCKLQKKKKKNLPKGKVCIQGEKRVGIWPWSFPLRVFLEKEEESTCKCVNEINKDRNCTGCSRLERDILEERKIHFVLMICVSVSSTHFQLGSYT